MSAFNIFRNNQVTPAISREFYQFYKWLSESKYFSANPASACIRIPPIDLFSLHRVKDKENFIGALLKKQPHWNQGRNTLILSFNRHPQGSNKFLTRPSRKFKHFKTLVKQ